MIKVAIVLLVAFAASLIDANKTPEIFLPPDAEIVDIVGNGFKLQVTQLNNIREQWGTVAEQTAQVEAPRPDDGVVINTNLYEETKHNVGVKDYGLLDEDLKEWVETRSIALTDKIERFARELLESSGGQRIVVDILLMNTLVDLENLTKENLRFLRWIKNKLGAMERLKNGLVEEVSGWVKSRIADNLKIEKKVRGTNKPGEKWVTNVQAIKRILNEQRFSESISKQVIDYLKGSFSMMERARVFEQNRLDKKLDDGLYYKRAKGRVPAHFPFSSQEAIMNGI